MALSNQDTFLWCKSQFEAALQLFRLGHGELVSPQFGNPDFEAKIMDKIQKLQLRIANEELVQLYLMALNRKSNEEESDLKKPSHKVGDILLEYFQGEGQAILYLEKVSAQAIVRLTIHQRQLMLNDRDPDDDVILIRGPDFQWRDDMWWYIYEMHQSFDPYTPSGPPHIKKGKKRSRDLDEDLSDPPCSLTRAGKRVRSFSYHV